MDGQRASSNEVHALRQQLAEAGSKLLSAESRERVNQDKVAKLEEFLEQARRCAATREPKAGCGAGAVGAGQCHPAGRSSTYPGPTLAMSVWRMGIAQQAVVER